MKTTRITLSDELKNIKVPSYIRRQVRDALKEECTDILEKIKNYEDILEPFLTNIVRRMIDEKTLAMFDEFPDIFEHINYLLLEGDAIGLSSNAYKEGNIEVSSSISIKTNLPNTIRSYSTLHVNSKLLDQIGISEIEKDKLRSLAHSILKCRIELEKVTRTEGGEDIVSEFETYGKLFRHYPKVYELAVKASYPDKLSYVTIDDDAEEDQTKKPDLKTTIYANDKTNEVLLKKLKTIISI